VAYQGFQVEDENPASGEDTKVKDKISVTMDGEVVLQAEWETEWAEGERYI
jgi:hypothetical protein